MYLNGLTSRLDPANGSAFDTTIVVFFLGLEFGRTILDWSFDGFLLFLTMLMVIALPYYLPAVSERPGLGKWLAGRSMVAVLAIGIGTVLDRAFGAILPDGFRFVPLTLLIIAAMTSCFIQFYALMRLRLAK